MFEIDLKFLEMVHFDRTQCELTERVRWCGVRLGCIICCVRHVHVYLISKNLKLLSVL